MTTLRLAEISQAVDFAILIMKDVFTNFTKDKRKRKSMFKKSLRSTSRTRSSSKVLSKPIIISSTKAMSNRWHKVVKK